jgi:hypothetical protein
MKNKALNRAKRENSNDIDYIILDYIVGNVCMLKRCVLAVYWLYAAASVLDRLGTFKGYIFQSAVNLNFCVPKIQLKIALNPAVQ